jgi:hypothetical protein
MTTRRYKVALTATISVDDTTVQAALLNFRLADDVAYLSGPAGRSASDFAAQQSMLAAAANWTPEQRMKAVLFNPYYVKANPEIKRMLEARMPGATVTMTGIAIDLDEADA